MHVQLVQTLGEEQLEYWQPTQEAAGGKAGAFGGRPGGATIEGMAGHAAASALGGHEPPPLTRIPASPSPPEPSPPENPPGPGALLTLPLPVASAPESAPPAPRSVAPLHPLAVVSSAAAPNAIAIVVQRTDP
jgi:hypothetical protein